MAGVASTSTIVLGSYSFTARIRRFAVWVTLIAAIFGAASACGPQMDNSHVHLTPPKESTAVGPGDVFVAQIVGEKDLPQEFQIASDGSVDLPYLHRVHVAGLEPQEIADFIRRRLRKANVLADASVIVRVQQYNSKHVSVLGQVQKPGNFNFSQGLTLIEAISLAGGFNAIANRDRVNLTRKTDKGTDSVIVSVDAISAGRSPDFPLQAGDQIYVNERVF